MGRLKNPSKHLNQDFIANFARKWTVPSAIAIAIVFGVNLTLANPAPTSDELSLYLQTNQLQVSSEVAGDRQQIYYLYNGDKFFVTNNDRNHINPAVRGEHMAWVEVIDGAGQIVIYNVLTGASMQVTSSGNNQNPAIDQSGVVWERWIDEKWQIVYYDGALTTKTLTFGETSIRPDIRGTEVVFAQRSSTDDLWHNIKYDLTTDQVIDLGSSDGSTAWPHFNEDGSVSGEPTN